MQNSAIPPFSLINGYDPFSLLLTAASVVYYEPGTKLQFEKDQIILQEPTAYTYLYGALRLRGAYRWLQGNGGEDFDIFKVGIIQSALLYRPHTNPLVCDLFQVARKAFWCFHRIYAKEVKDGKAKELVVQTLDHCIHLIDVACRDNIESAYKDEKPKAKLQLAWDAEQIKLISDLFKTLEKTISIDLSWQPDYEKQHIQHKCYGLKPLPLNYSEGEMAMLTQAEEEAIHKAPLKTALPFSVLNAHQQRLRNSVASFIASKLLLAIKA